MRSDCVNCEERPVDVEQSLPDLESYQHCTLCWDFFFLDVALDYGWLDPFEAAVRRTLLEARARGEG
jgi:hypothetical protein